MGGVDYLIVALEFGPRDEVVEWANGIIASYPNHRTIVTTHGYMDSNGLLDASHSGSPNSYGYASQQGNTVNNGVDLWNKLYKKHENIFMVMCGHMDDEDIVVVPAEGEKGNTVLQVLVNNQSYEGSGIGNVMLMKFNEKDGTVSFEWYSTYYGAYFREENQFTLSLEGRFVVDENKQAALAVDELIAAIGTVTKESESVIAAARAAYDALTEEQRTLVTAIDALTAAENAYKALTGAQGGCGGNLSTAVGLLFLVLASHGVKKK